MTPLEMAVVRRKLRRIRGNIATLSTATDEVDSAAYAADELRKRAVERLLQETVDAAVDINNHLLKSIGQPPAEDYFGSFVQLGRSGIVDTELATYQQLKKPAELVFIFDGIFMNHASINPYRVNGRHDARRSL